MANEQMTVERLIKHLQNQVKKNPSIKTKIIVLSDDVEGNSYHGLWYGLTTDESSIKDIIEFSNGVSDSQSDNYQDIVILG